MAGPPKILLLESHYPTQQTIASAIRSQQWEVVFATEVYYVMTVAKRAKPDAVVIGSEFTGGELAALKLLRANASTAATPIVALCDSVEEESALIAAGANRCFRPPLEPAKILEAIDDARSVATVPAEAPVEIIHDPDRLKALQNTGQLDSAADATYDVLTSLAAKLLDAPTALMSLVDDHRQFFKSQVGLGEPWSSQRQTPLSHSFCQWVVSGNDELVVENAREHPLLSQNGAVRDLGVQAYVGIPLKAMPNQPIGSFCAIDSRPRPWSEEDRETLADLAQIVSAYVAIQQVEGELGDNSAIVAETSTVMEMASNALQGATRVLNRRGDRLGESERQQLQAIVEAQSSKLLNIARI